MKRFKFRLETVQRVRQNEEKNALREVADAQAKLQSEISTKNELLIKLEKALTERSLLGSVPVKREHFQIMERLIVGTKQRIIQSDQAILRARRNLNKAYMNFFEKRKKKKMIEKLRENSEREYREQRRKHEAKILDELYTMRNRLGGTEW